MKNAKDSGIEKFLKNEIQKSHAYIDLLKESNDNHNLNQALGFLSALLLVQNFVNEKLEKTLKED